MGTRILWQRIDRPGHELSSLEPHAGGWRLAGTVLLAHDTLPCQLNYDIQCNSNWETQTVSVNGHLGAKSANVVFSRNPAGAWYSNDEHVPEVDGCTDIDLGFSPATNLLPIRRLALPIGGRAVVRAAWLPFPELSLKLLDQVYTRLDSDHYLYESADGSFQRNLHVGADGFVLEYPDYWRTVAIAKTE